jgi:nucleoside-diphosphate-sugar epimerase
MTYNPLEQDLNYVLSHTRELWEDLRENRIFITGGTGFFGCWLLESFVWANDHLNLGASAVVLTRNPAAFERKGPHLASHSSIRLQAGDVRSFEFPAGQFRFVIHAATEANTQTALDAPLETLDTIVEGTRRMLEFARHCGAAKVLFTSSGAVYGKQPPEITHLPETFLGGPDPVDLRSVYGESKRLAELLCTSYAARYGMECKIARCFAFAGPYLPTDGHFAFGSFLRDALQGNSIRVNGDGTPYRSYLYAADLAIWLWTILFRGENCRPYNVGSEHAVNIAELANRIVRTLNPGLKVEIARDPVPGQLPQHYVPSTRRAQSELGLLERIDLSETIVRTARWHSQRSIPG